MPRMSVSRTWRYIEERYRLVGSKCEKCGKIFYPPRPVCPDCHSREMSKIELSRRGKVESYTILYSVPEGYRLQSPLILAFVRLDDGIRIFTQLTDVDPEEVRIGMPVEAVFRRITEDGAVGIIRYGMKFRPLL